MLLMSHFDKTEMNIGYYYRQGSTTDTLIKNLNIVGLKTMKCHVTSPKQNFAIYPPPLPPSQLKIPTLKHLDDVQ